MESWIDRLRTAPQKMTQIVFHLTYQTPSVSGKTHPCTKRLARVLHGLEKPAADGLQCLSVFGTSDQDSELHSY